MPRRFLTQTERAAIASDYAEGMSFNAIRRKYGIAYSTVHYSVKVSGVAIRAPYGRKKPHCTDEAIVWMHGRGIAANAIAKKMGVHKSTILHRAKRLGLKFYRYPSMRERECTPTQSPT